MRSRPLQSLFAHAARRAPLHGVVAVALAVGADYCELCHSYDTVAAAPRIAAAGAWERSDPGNRTLALWHSPVGARPHPAVARIIVSEGLSTSYGSGTLIDRRDDFGLVITNWHVVRDSQGDIEVVFPDGFSSKARALKVDPDWDLAALVIWRPNSTPVKIAATAPRPGDRLTICGYGQGQYREATGRCTKYYAPRLDFPEHMVELNVEARQGDSGGPIFDDRGELAGVLFGAGEGTTLGSFGGRVHSFLATLAPGIGVSESAPDGVPNPTRIGDVFAAGSMTGADDSQSNSRVQNDAASALRSATTNVEGTMAGARTPVDGSPQNADGWHSNRTADKSVNGPDAPAESYAASRVDWFDHLKSVLAAIGVVAIVVAILRSVR